MSRHSTITQTLRKLEQDGVIVTFARSSTETEQRARWHVQLDAVTALTLTTTEVEAFIAGVRAALHAYGN